MDHPYYISPKEYEKLEKEVRELKGALSLSRSECARLRDIKKEYETRFIIANKLIDSIIGKMQ